MPRRPRLLAAVLAALLGLGAVVGGGSAPAVAACSIDGLAKDVRLASFSGYVVDADSGTKLFSQRGATPRSTGSILKLLTGTAAIDVLGAKHRIATTVVRGTKPGTVVLVGGGDPTLSRVANGYYPGAARLSSLARQVRQAMRGQRIRKVVVDATLWGDADAWDRTWKPSERRIGYLGETSALQVDGDRNDPRASVSPRGTHPDTRAGRWFARALGVPNATVVRGTAPAGARRLGVVRSAPVGALVRFMLRASDGTIAESLARLTSLAAGGDGSRRSLDHVVTASLARYGLPTDDVRVYDGSGLSTRNAVSPRFVTRLLRELRAGPPRLRAVYRGLSIAGRTGGLASRFTGSSAIARGRVLAKTGWLDTEYSLAGIVHARDGSTQAFAFYAIGPRVRPAAKRALDALVAGVYRCGAALS
ncbi:D-alanyl-D-alanine carboxypeptidase [Galbitalea sp. SE-J8]|uniref:D-alanyl-D-alanine carboxypeptidase/D-alanyl-D-alanine-endopeptidase n=1 Tax=Galbitalea sp. SE-J8 TaxID=3054952 RepID=UPI00259CE036|nr:D-alanyl-D-alanine carboxypeptidase [Galbitalea sp. SE-J8]MDM4763614.1 D-alanyl-D-alanine carboxypeptidase [Galbitalea sp. SE-J8]